mgnify:CR=1 FL=1
MTDLLMRKRIVALFLLAATFVFVLVVRLAWVQLVQGDRLRKQALENRVQGLAVEAKRGSFYDRNGKELVTSVNADSVVCYPALVADPRKTARQVAAILEMDEEEVYRLLTLKVGSAYIKRRVELEKIQKLKALHLPGIDFVPESKRYYLKGNLAAHLIGFVGDDNQGLTGLELTFDTELRGIPGRIVLERDALGREIPSAVHQYYEPVPGHNLILTIDENVQYFVERELDKIVDTYHPKNAVIIVMDPRTGEILAMGNRPTFDPNRWIKFDQAVWDRTPAIWYNYEPGSTFKIITLAAAFEEGTVHLNDQFYDPGYIKVADRLIHCWLDGGHGSQTLTEVVQNSCNPGFVRIGLDLGLNRFYKYVEAFGFGKATGIDLPGEASGIVIPKKEATELNLATMAIGQSIAVTPLQLITAVCAVANGGMLMQPQLVKAVTDAEGRVLREYKPRPVRRVLSEKTAHQVSLLLEEVVLKGTGRNAWIEGYRTGGKTGTAQVVGSTGGYVEGKYVASFVGFAPVEDPQVAILVMISEPQGGVYFGAQVAAPSFAAVMRDTLHYLGIPEKKGLPRPKSPYEWVTPSKPSEVAVPRVVGLPLDKAVEQLRAQNLNFVTRGQGGQVASQVPEAGAKVLEGTTVILHLRQAPQAPTGRVTVPDVTGMTVKQAGELLASLGLAMEPEGSGLAFRQAPPPGEEVARGITVKVFFRPGGD